jgi:WS/DGAT/MGAT family acyltransferase
MSPLDASFLYIENEFNHMHIAFVAIFEGPPPQGHEVEEMISSKLDLVPRYRQKVRFVPFDVGRPVWSDDHHFDLHYHVRRTALPSPGLDEQLHTLVGRVMSQKLDRAKPLWEIWVVEGLADGRWAMLSKTHHCMVDGVSGSDLLSVLLDSTPDLDHPAGAPWEPERRPSGFSLLADSIAQGFRRPSEGLRNLRKLVTTPARAFRELADLTDALSTFRGFTKTELESSLNGPIGPHRRWCHASTTIAEISKIRNAHGGTVNDVALSAITQGFRSLLLSRGEPVDGLFVRTLVPVSVRSDEERGTLNNRVAAMFAELPMEIADPVERLAAIREEMGNLKEHHQADASETLNSISDFSPPAFLALGARLFAGLEQHTVQTVTTNVPGPRQPLFAAHRRMLEAYLYVPLAGSVRIGVAIFSYAGRLTFGVTGDYESASDIDILGAGIEAGIKDLLSAS